MQIYDFNVQKKIWFKLDLVAKTPPQSPKKAH